MGNATRCPLPGGYTMRTGLGPAMLTGDASKGPTTNATRYVDMIIVLAKRTSRRPLPIDEEATSEVFEYAARCSGMSSVTSYVALNAGSSQHGKARRASVDSNCVVAMRWVSPSGSSNV